AEVPLAFERHATSKIRTADDLFAVATLGFRGEALPSIAAVAEVEMRTRTADSLQGTRYVIVAGQPQEAGPVGAPVGTTVIVRRLFFNTPARYKFLRTDATEKRYVADVAARLALARPDVAVRLLADGRELLATPGDGRLMSAALAIYGPQAARELLPVALEAEGIAVEGLVARPTWHHGNRERLTVVLNGRAIQSPAVARAIEKGYDTLLPSRRFPVGVVHITMDPRAVDVNVHPAKAEVRFRDDSLVFRVVLRAVREGLLGANLVAGLAPGEAVPPPVPPAGGGRAPGFQVRESYGPPPRLRQHEPPNAGESPQAHAPLGSQEPAGGQGLSHAQDLGGTDPWATDAEGEDARRQLREMTVLGQLHRTYILGETPAGLWIVDQHVAHERVLYERLLRAAAGGQADVQQLLMPVTITLAPAQAG